MKVEFGQVVFPGPFRRLTPPHLACSPTPSIQTSMLLQLECAARLHASLLSHSWPLLLAASPASHTPASPRPARRVFVRACAHAVLLCISIGGVIV